MLASKRKGICIPYSNLVTKITKILEHTGFNFKREESNEDVTKIGENALAMGMYDTLNEKHPKERKEEWNKNHPRI